MNHQTEAPNDTITVEALSEILSRLSENSLKKIQSYIEKEIKGDSGSPKTYLRLFSDFFTIYGKILSNPSMLMKAEVAYMTGLSALIQESTLKLMGVKSAALFPEEKSKQTDKRFKNKSWEENPWFRFLKELYLLNGRTLLDAIRSVEGVDQKTKLRVDFFARQFVDAVSPSNYLATNPELIEATIESRGENLLRGLRNLLDDLERGPCLLQVQNTDIRAFELGKDIASTPGYVIAQNDLTQLIQYEPTTKKVYNRPILIVPPWINKYYILDLRPDNSLIKYLVDGGYTVFVISWVNPDASHAGFDFEDYLEQGPVSALKRIEEITGVKQVNTIGYCMGGTLLACAAAYLKAINEGGRIASATYMAALIDFSNPGDMGVFIDEEQISEFERKMNEKGFLDGCAMANTFNMLRSNDLIWSSVINTYIKGRDPAPFDLLYWNSDATNMPARMHSFYLRNMYLENRLIEPGRIVLKGFPIDVSQIDCPAYFVSAYEDHIALWHGTYLGARRVSGPVRFVLAGSGHIAGIINPPSANKYYFLKNPDLPASSDEWLKGAERNEGSWWPDWLKWNAKYRGKSGPARPVNQERALDKAPGCYVTNHLQRPETAECTTVFI